MYTVKQIAEQLGITERAVRARIKLRGIKHRCFNENGTRLYTEKDYIKISEKLKTGRK
jgi:DNA-binding transcriptional MerR regulator